MDAEALNKSAGIVVLFRAFVIEERASTVGALGEDGLKMRCKIGMLLRARPLATWCQNPPLFNNPEITFQK
ncbi:MAG: hypothetical protein GXP18_01310 [Gammaproteobacteria bacterium]|nr:hypothetical protein [Gammaproteobacteria bacterium]